MALLEKDEKKPSHVSPELSALCDKIFGFQYLSKTYERMAKEEKEPAIAALIADPNVQMSVGEGYEVNDHGMVIPSDRSYRSYNAIAMHERTKLKEKDPKHVRIEDLINCIKPDGFDFEKVEQVFGQEGLGQYVTTRKQRQFSFKATVAYKTELKQQYFPGMDVPDEEEEEKPKPKTAKAKPKVKDKV